MLLPKYSELYKEVLESLADGKSLKIKEIVEFVARLKNIPEEIRKIRNEKNTYFVFDDRVAWSRYYLYKAGLIEYPVRGFNRITEEGLNVLKENPEPFNNEYLKKYESFRSFLNGKPKDENNNAETNSDIEEKTPEELIDLAFSQINSALVDEVLTEIMGMNPYSFEKFVANLLKKMGYGDPLITPKSNDGGIDIIIKEDKLGFGNIYVQTKRYAIDKTVGRPEIQQFVGAISNTQSKKGLFVTTAKFTKDAAKYAENNHIVLVDGEKLVQLMSEYSFGISTKIYEIKKIDSDFFSDDY